MKNPLSNSLSRNLVQRDWKQFWAVRNAPMHRRDEPDFYAEHSADLRLLFEKYHPRTVLELCCGNGALYQHLGFDRTQYLGVDFSGSMLADFAASHAGVKLEEADVSEYVRPQQFDLILMEFAAGYFNATTLARVFCHARAMMHSTSVFVCSSIPWSAARWEFYSGKFTPPYVPNFNHLLRARAKWLLGISDPIGNWHDPVEISGLALQSGLVAEFFGCHSYIYRFHAALRVASADESSSSSASRSK
jgi:SAM-dependent methyltransferase